MKKKYAFDKNDNLVKVNNSSRQVLPIIFPADTYDCDCKMLIGGSGELCPDCSIDAKRKELIKEYQDEPKTNENKRQREWEICFNHGKLEGFNLGVSMARKEMMDNVISLYVKRKLPKWLADELKQQFGDKI